MKIEWINHAGFILETESAAVITDPWLEGAVFDESWSQIAPTKFDYSDFSRATHLWFSHEHPDHFFPPNLKKIPKDARAKLHILFQKTLDSRVAAFTRKMGFASVSELERSWLQLGADLEFYCGAAGRGDSWGAFKSRGTTLINLNDCIFLNEGGLTPVKDIVGPVDVLVTQFSYASWWGNEDGAEAWRAAAKSQLEKIKLEVEVLKPKFVLLSASFVFFSHKENWYMNRWSNTVQEAFDFVSALPGVTPIVLYPGDVWTCGDAHDSSHALSRYRDDLERALREGPREIGKVISVAELKSAAMDFMGRLKSSNSRLLLWRLPRPLIHDTDHDTLFALSLGGLEIRKRGRADVRLSSSALLYYLKNDWGGETLTINGRFSAPEGGDVDRFFRWSSIASANRHGISYGLDFYLKKIFGFLRR